MTNDDLIQKYFENRLSAQEVASFDALLASDTEFAAEVRFQQNLKKAISAQERNKLKEKFQSFESKKTTFPNWLAYAASILVILGITYWIYMLNPSDEKLYSEYFETYPNVVEPIIRNNNGETTIRTRAFAAYENGAYETSAAIFSSIADNSDDGTARFYQALSLMNIERTTEAAKILSDTDWSPRYSDKALWYLGLCQLKLGEIEKCKTILRTIVNSKGYHSQEAGELLAKL
ncbi:MAG: hypothetical protein ITG00_08765 [Flavobacterium sp.]|nr:hypothetical protein [Flavobacterium sp.]